jgi:hypothetical protein
MDKSLNPRRHIAIHRVWKDRGSSSEVKNRGRSI